MQPEERREALLRDHPVRREAFVRQHLVGRQPHHRRAVAEKEPEVLLQGLRRRLVGLDAGQGALRLRRELRQRMSARGAGEAARLHLALAVPEGGEHLGVRGRAPLRALLEESVSCRRRFQSTRPPPRCRCAGRAEVCNGCRGTDQTTLPGYLR